MQLASSHMDYLYILFLILIGGQDWDWEDAYSNGWNWIGEKKASWCIQGTIHGTVSFLWVLLLILFFPCSPICGCIIHCLFIYAMKTSSIYCFETACIQVWRKMRLAYKLWCYILLCTRLWCWSTPQQWENRTDFFGLYSTISTQISFPSVSHASVDQNSLW